MTILMLTSSKALADTLQGIGRGIISAPTELVETITNINTMGTGSKPIQLLTALLQRETTFLKMMASHQCRSKKRLSFVNDWKFS